MVQDSFAMLSSRLQSLEEGQRDTALALDATSCLGTSSATGAAPDPSVHDDLSEQLAMLKQWVQDLTAKSDRVFQDSHDVYARVAAHETQLGTLRTLFDKREDQLKALTDQVEKGAWEKKYELTQKAAQEEASQRRSQQERLELLLKR